MISIILPTRGRSDRLNRFISSALNNAENRKQIEFLIFVDTDDYETNISLKSKNIRLIRGNRQWLSICYNIAANWASGEILMYAADDLIIETKNWDSILIESVAKNRKNCQLICPSDNTAYSGFLATHGFVTREFVKNLGYFMTPYFSESHLDTWLTHISKRANCFYYEPKIKLFHDHYRQANQNYKIDGLNHRRNLQNIRNNTEVVFQKMHREREKDALRLALGNHERLSVNIKFIAGRLGAKFLKFHPTNPYYFRLNTMTNSDFFRSIIIKILKNGLSFPKLNG